MEDGITIVVAGDNHMYKDPIKDLLERYPDADFFLHIGDSGQRMEELEGWISVSGNNDYDPKYPLERIIQAGSHRILLVHGDRLIYRGGLVAVADAGRTRSCDIVCYGHTHRYCDKTVNGIRLLNPGSLRYNRDQSPASYMLVRIRGEEITAERKEL